MCLIGNINYFSPQFNSLFDNNINFLFDDKKGKATMPNEFGRTKNFPSPRKKNIYLYKQFFKDQYFQNTISFISKSN